MRGAQDRSISEIVQRRSAGRRHFSSIMKTQAKRRRADFAVGRCLSTPDPGKEHGKGMVSEN